MSDDTQMKAHIVEREGVRFSVTDENDQELGRAYLYVLTNDLHEQPFGFLEDVHVSEEARGQGVGTRLINKVIATAQARNCYKIVATSRFERERVHAFYEKNGFTEHGKEFRIDL